MLSRGMKDIGHVSISHLQDLVLAIRNPWIAGGIVLLLAFFAAYMAALSWADLTYVLPATSLGYVLLALIAKFVLREQVTLLRWVGIGLIAIGVSFVASGPELTRSHSRADERVPEPEFASSRGQR
jgi:drug/metabolite transporter (DMT)-like permease